MLFGELAALGTALCFSLSSTCFTLASRRAGSTPVNRVRLLAATLIACGLHLATRGEALPLGLSPGAWMWLGISGVIGLTLGDDLLFRSYVLIGPALAMLVFALNPVLAAFAGAIFLDESLTAREWTGIVITIAGIASVVSKRKPTIYSPTERSYLAGLLLAFGGAVGQAGGIVTAKLGLVEGAPAQSANVIRLVAATAAAWLVTAAAGRLAKTVGAFSNDPRAASEVTLGALLGPVAGVWLSLVAIEHAPVGVASTLMSITPLFLLPISRVVFQEPVTLRAVLGTAVALAGVALLLL